jgi:hypothetical protein
MGEEVGASIASNCTNRQMVYRTVATAEEISRGDRGFADGISFQGDRPMITDMKTPVATTLSTEETIDHDRRNLIAGAAIGLAAAGAASLFPARPALRIEERGCPFSRSRLVLDDASTVQGNVS